MKEDLTDFQKNTRLLAENENPYAKECPNRHLYNEGFTHGFEMAVKLRDGIIASLPASQEIDISGFSKELQDEFLRFSQNNKLGKGIK